MSHALNQIRQAGFKLELDNDDLIIEPYSKITAPQLRFLKAHKIELIEALRREHGIKNRDSYDDRRYCHECANLSAGRCLAAGRGEIKGARQYHPIDDIPRRCEGYAPINRI